MRTVFIILIFMILSVSCYNPLDFKDFDKISANERINNFKGSSELTNFSVKLEWETKDFEDFLEYRVYRSTTTSINENSTLVFSSTEKQQNSFYDYILEPETIYYYKIYTSYEKDLLIEGNVIEVETPQQPPNNFILYGDYPNINISRMTEDGTGKINLFSSGYEPTWHPKGYCFAFAQSSTNSNSNYEIILSDLNGLTSIPLGEISVTGYSDIVDNICWSRNARYLFVLVGPSANIYKIDLQTKTISFFMTGDNIRCSPTSDEILVSNNREDVKIYNYSGQLINTLNFQMKEFTGGNYALNADRFAYIFSGLHIYNFSSGTTQEVNLSSVDIDPFWSKDGKKLFFVRNHDLYNYNGEGSNGPVLVTQDVIFPDWAVLNKP